MWVLGVGVRLGAVVTSVACEMVWGAGEGIHSRTACEVDFRQEGATGGVSWRNTSAWVGLGIGFGWKCTFAGTLGEGQVSPDPPGAS